VPYNQADSFLIACRRLGRSARMLGYLLRDNICVKELLLAMPAQQPEGSPAKSVGATVFDLYVGHVSFLSNAQGAQYLDSVVAFEFDAPAYVAQDVINHVAATGQLPPSASTAPSAAAAVAEHPCVQARAVAAVEQCQTSRVLSPASMDAVLRSAKLEALKYAPWTSADAGARPLSAGHLAAQEAGTALALLFLEWSRGVVPLIDHALGSDALVGALAAAVQAPVFDARTGSANGSPLAPVPAQAPTQTVIAAVLPGYRGASAAFLAACLETYVERSPAFAAAPAPHARPSGPSFSRMSFGARDCAANIAPQTVPALAQLPCYASAAAPAFAVTPVALFHTVTKRIGLDNLRGALQDAAGRNAFASAAAETLASLAAAAAAPASAAGKGASSAPTPASPVASEDQFTAALALTARGGLFSVPFIPHARSRPHWGARGESRTSVLVASGLLSPTASSASSAAAAASPDDESAVALEVDDLDAFAHLLIAALARELDRRILALYMSVADAALSHPGQLAASPTAKTVGTNVDASTAALQARVSELERALINAQSTAAGAAAGGAAGPAPAAGAGAVVLGTVTAASRERERRVAELEQEILAVSDALAAEVSGNMTRVLQAQVDVLLKEKRALQIDAASKDIEIDAYRARVAELEAEADALHAELAAAAPAAVGGSGGVSAGAYRELLHKFGELQAEHEDLLVLLASQAGAAHKQQQQETAEQQAQNLLSPAEAVVAAIAADAGGAGSAATTTSPVAERKADDHSPAHAIRPPQPLLPAMPVPATASPQPQQAVPSQVRASPRPLSSLAAVVAPASAPDTASDAVDADAGFSAASPTTEAEIRAMYAAAVLGADTAAPARPAPAPEEYGAVADVYGSGTSTANAGISSAGVDYGDASLGAGSDGYAGYGDANSVPASIYGRDAYGHSDYGHPAIVTGAPVRPPSSVHAHAHAPSEHAFGEHGYGASAQAPFAPLPSEQQAAQPASIAAPELTDVDLASTEALQQSQQQQQQQQQETQGYGEYSPALAAHAATTATAEDEYGDSLARSRSSVLADVKSPQQEAGRSDAGGIDFDVPLTDAPHTMYPVPAAAATPAPADALGAYDSQTASVPDPDWAPAPAPYQAPALEQTPQEYGGGYGGEAAALLGAAFGDDYDAAAYAPASVAADAGANVALGSDYIDNLFSSGGLTTGLGASSYATQQPLQQQQDDDDLGFTIPNLG
jgi:hypothetical protein